MKQAAVYQLVLDIVREVACGRPVASGTEFSAIGIGPWQRQRFCGPLRYAFGRRDVDITGTGLTQASFTRYRTLRQVQAAIWEASDQGQHHLGPRARPVSRRFNSPRAESDA